jgi:hypothetical protein
MKSDGAQSRIDVRSGGGGNMCFGFHEGARSEILAQYLFSAFGAVSRVLQHEDYGIDLYCSLAEKVSSAWLVRDVYFVQVKSESVPSWLLSGTLCFGFRGIQFRCSWLPWTARSGPGGRRRRDPKWVSCARPGACANNLVQSSLGCVCLTRLPEGTATTQATQ